ncbi:MAG: DUF4118 domain-containing protein [Finegoldia magna]|uniref:Sensor histidine kinase KdpD n=1 Tax=Finegoldia magna TaxID=1260 RepID=A0A943QNA0_FINMA|nr:DUF4118 domain-containing protein [Finegoldia magna]MBS5964534.1 sensor histidine kinase KdpD [Finegoldia magna]MDU4017936.1 DUF4118 domain-containing protein [Finegoldia magna]MDU5223835.1 DUF4118 domain-containing protein [Finegoldia magna]MDU5236008.1 DUF4118 domain-containing protein [Finegoldia magna]
MDKKGKLTIFFGYCAGVGKTYSMLKYAHEKDLDGADVVIGYIEPHDRKDTLDLINGLQRVENKKITYKNHVFYELDLDSIIKRKPQIVLVDELAHTNAPTSRHKKRYQDIEELLKAGIDVYTTLNVQHLESLHDIIESITRIKINERIPDYIFDNADNIKIIDIEVEQLLQRLKSGKIYNTMQSQKALANFFTKGNLVSLREITLRRCADRINLYTDEKNRPFLKEHILVCISPSPTNQKVIRTAYRMAKSFHAEFSALFVETSNLKFLSQKEKYDLQANINLAKHLKANLVSTYGDDVAFQISQYAKVSGISKLVLGRSLQKVSLLRKSTIIDSITKTNPTLDIFIIPDANQEPKKVKLNLENPFQFDIEDFLTTFSIILVSTLLSFFFFELDFSTTNIVLVYILSTCIVGFTTKHPIYNVISSIINILIIDYFFLEPYFSFIINSKEYFMIFLIMSIVSFIICLMQNKLKKENLLAIEQSHNFEILFKISQSLQSANNYDKIMYQTCYHLYKLLNRVIVFYPIKDNELKAPKIYNPENNESANNTYVSEAEKTVAQWVYLNNESAGATTNTLSSAKGLYFAIRKGNYVYGVVGIDMSYSKKNISLRDKSLLLAMLNEVALAMDSIEH